MELPIVCRGGWVSNPLLLPVFDGEEEGEFAKLLWTGWFSLSAYFDRRNQMLPDWILLRTGDCCCRRCWICYRRSRR
ncbi:hypothetical protein ACLOJK_036110 [Asimina triloba]